MFSSRVDLTAPEATSKVAIWVAGGFVLSILAVVAIVAGWPTHDVEGEKSQVFVSPCWKRSFRSNCLGSRITTIIRCRCSPIRGSIGLMWRETLPFARWERGRWSGRFRLPAPGIGARSRSRCCRKPVSNGKSPVRTCVFRVIAPTTFATSSKSEPLFVT